MNQLSNSAGLYLRQAPLPEWLARYSPPPQKADTQACNGQDEQKKHEVVGVQSPLELGFVEYYHKNEKLYSRGWNTNSVRNSYGSLMFCLPMAFGFPMVVCFEQNGSHFSKTIGNLIKMTTILFIG